MRLPFLRTRWAQVIILILLIVSAAQVFWWIVDQSRRTEKFRKRLTAIYQQDAEAARELRDHGADAETLDRLYSHLDVSPEGEFSISPEALESLREDRARWLNQYGWEGAFFLGVLLISMGAVWRALHEEAVLRRRQQNFVAAVSHELKSPLSSMRLSVETLSLRQPPPERVRELAQRMTDDIDRMESMVGKILEASRFEERHVHQNAEDLALLPMLRTVLDGLENHRQGTPAEVEIQVDPTLEVRADAQGVRSVLRNLIENAIRAVTTAGGGTVRVSAEPDGEFVHLKVEDDGVGFEPDEKNMLFEKFYRPGDEIRRQGGGQGLGLYIVRRYLELGKGRVRAHSDGTGKGATFEVWWPAAGRTEP